ncbi:nuclear transport factor 2 family protein [Sphingomonas caeni]|uniref:nuclear transport factor 2 family protein n=1 Tax=Sphingomonas caeni TaxID=2984949 RepID=UPI0022329AAF|nr:nuclear transport factor 2 family protein [Sphingomonas caeni]
MFEQYIAAFNAGDAEAYARFYAPDIRFRNGAGAELTGPAAIIDYYQSLKDSLSRTIEVKALAHGERAFAAALASRFTILADGVRFAGELLGRGDQVHLESIALYELEDGRFTRIEATTLTRRIARHGDPSP